MSKLFVFDQKHQNVLNEMEIRDLDETRRIVNFLDRAGFTDRYKRLIIAKNFNIVFDEESSESTVEFIYDR